jgi:RNA polymerase sigma-70 factor, ECF subfamily
VNIEELYKEYSSSIYRVCLRYTRDSNQAEDLMQEVFVKLYQNPKEFLSDKEYFAWIYRLAINHCLDFLRVKKRRGELENLNVIPFRALSERSDIDIENKRTVEQILAKLDAQVSQILFLYYLEGLTYEEVSEVMGVSRALIHKKLKKLDINSIFSNIILWVLVIQLMQKVLIVIKLGRA